MIRQYRIEVAGEIGLDWKNWLDESKVKISNSNTESTLLNGLFDQAELIGLLRRLYYLGLPLLSVNATGKPEEGDINE